MDITKFLAAAKTKIKNKDFKGALSELEPILIFSGNNFEPYVLAGFCHRELNNYQKLEEYLAIADEKKPDDPLILTGLYQAYSQTNKFKNCEVLPRLCAILEKQLDKQDKVQKYFEYKLNLLGLFCEYADKNKAEKLYFELCEDPKVSVEVLFQASTIVFDYYMDSEKRIEFIILDKFCKIFMKNQEILKVDKILEKILLFYEKSLHSKPNDFKKTMDFIYLGFPSSFMSLNFSLKHIGLFLNDFPNDFFLNLIQDCLSCLFLNETSSQNTEKNFILLKNANPALLAEIDFYARCFLTFSKLFLAKYLKFPSAKMKDLFSAFEVNYLQKFLDTIVMFDDSYVLSIPLKIFSKIQNKKLEESDNLIKIFKEKIEELSNLTSTLSLIFIFNNFHKWNLYRRLEEINGEFLIQTTTDNNLLIENKDKLKLRLRNKEKSIDTLKIFYELQMKITRSIYIFDEEFDLIEFIGLILNEEKDNFEFYGEKLWFELSYNKIPIGEYILTLIKQFENSLDLMIKNPETDVKVLSKFKKRLGTLYWINNCCDGNNQKIDVGKMWMEVYNLTPQDYQINFCLGFYYWQTGEQNEALKFLKNAFILNHYDMNLNKILFFALSKTMRSEAINFAFRIYPNFKDCFFLNYSLGLYFMKEKKFEKAENLIVKSIEIFQNLKMNESLLFSKEMNFTLKEKSSTIPFLINQNKIFYLEDYPVFPDDIYEKEAPILSKCFFQKQNILLNEFKLWFQLAQINKNVGKIAAFEKCLIECFTLIKDETFQMTNSNSPFKKYFSKDLPLKTENAKKMNDLSGIFIKIFISSKKLMIEDFLKFDFKKYYLEALLTNLDFSTTSYYKRDFNAAFFHLDCCFTFLTIILEENLEINKEKLHDCIIDLFANLMEICSAYAIYVNKTQGASQALFYFKHLALLWEEFKLWKVVIENKLAENNLYFLKSCVEFFISYAIISMDAKPAHESIELCMKVLENLSGIKGETFLGELDDENMKLEDNSFRKNIMEIKNDYLEKSINNFLQSLAFSYVLGNIFAKNEKLKNRSKRLAKLGILIFNSETKFWNLLALIEEDPQLKINIALKTLRIDKRSTFSINTLGILFLTNEKYENAMNFFLKVLEINPKNTFAFLSLVCICLIVFIENSLEFNCISTTKNNFEKINDLQYMKDFFLSKAKSYTTFSILSKFSNQAFILDMIIQIFFKYEGTFQMSHYLTSNYLPGNNFTENQKDILMLFLYFNEINDNLKSKDISNKEYNYEVFAHEKENVDFISSLKHSFDENKDNLKEINVKLQDIIKNELKIQLENLSKFCSEDPKNKTDSLHRNIMLFIKFVFKMQIFMYLSIMTDSSFANLPIVENVLKALNSLPDLQKTHGNILNIMDVRSYYKGFLTSYYHFLNDVKKSLNFLGSVDLQNKFTEKMAQCLNVISNYHSDQRKMTEEDIIWPFEFLIEDQPFQKNSPEFFYLLSLEKMNENKHFESKKLLQKSILLDPSEIKYRETYLALTTLVEKSFVKNKKMLNFSKENNLSFLIKVIQESLGTVDKIKVFSKIMIYYPTIDVFYVFCRCWFEKNNSFDSNVYIRLTSYIKIYLNKRIDDFNKKWIRKLIKLYLQVIIHFRIILHKKKLFNYDIEKVVFEKQLNEDLKLITNHSEYITQEKIRVFHKMLEAFYSFDEENFSLETILQIFNGINEIDKKISFLLAISRRLIRNNENKEIFEEIQEIKKLIKTELDKIDKDIISSKIRENIKKLEAAINFLEVYVYIIAVKELHKSTSEFSKLELLTQLKESGEKILTTSAKKVNLIFIYIHYCNLTQKLDEMNDKLVIIESLLCNENEKMYWAFFCLLFHYHSVTKNPYDEEAYNGFKQFYEFIFEKFKLNSTFLSLLYFMKGIILLQNLVDVHAKKEDLRKYFKLACLHRPDKSSQFISYLANYEPNVENVKEEEKGEEQGEEEKNEVEEEEY